jgi:hypothetical protein
MSASKDALWIVDYSTNLPFKFNKKLKQFQQMGNQKAYRISAGINGHAMMTGSDRRLYTWIEADRVWKSLDDSKVWSVATGKKGRLYKVEYDT